jgi:hypothetical protein
LPPKNVLQKILAIMTQQLSFPGLLRAVTPRYRCCDDATLTLAVAPLLLVEKNGDGSAAAFSPVFFWRYALSLLLSAGNLYFGCQ